MDGENFGDPGDRRKNEENAMQKTTEERYARRRAEKHDQQNAHAHPGINAEVKTGIGKRESRSGNRGDEQPQPRGSFTSGMRAEIAEPRTTRHQCLTMALKPATSRPFLALSTAF